MKWIALLCCFCCPAGAESWTNALGRLPLPENTVLSRDNFIPAVLTAFQSNATVGGIVFLPAVSDDFYLVNRDKTKLNLRAPDIACAITGLTHATEVRATFSQGILFLHLARETVEPRVVIKHETTAAALTNAIGHGRVLWVDRHWKTVQPEIKALLNCEVLPKAASESAWHFARVNLAVCGVSQRQLLEAIVLSTGSQLTIERHRARFVRANR
ncbi:MAG: hypothetical protein L0Y58_04930 [Verrucomicrobia subdivision 3 bacterium]|nr:hypothetical protein [Limisphaerales bacterium]